MESAIVSVVCIALLVLGWTTMSQGYMASVDSTAVELGQMSERSGEIMRTELSALAASQPSADILEVDLGNIGQTKLGSFDNWDVIVKYYDSVAAYHIQWLTYTTGALGNNQWTKKGIYLDAATEDPEVFEPGLLNPGEEIIIQAKLSPTVGQGTDNMVVVSTPNGVPVSIAFIGYTP